MSLNDPGHFLHVNEVVQVSPHTPFQDVYDVLARSGRGGFVLQRKGASLYVKAGHLAGAVLTEEGALPRVCKEKIGLVVERFIDAATVPVDDVAADIQTDRSTLQNMPDRAFNVSQEGRIVGLFLNHESLFATSTQKTVWICARGHENAVPDSGTCGQCPAKIVSAR